MIVTGKTIKLILPSNGFKLRSGSILPRVDVAYETYGTLNRDKSNAILVCTPLSMDQHAAGKYSDNDENPGWWDEMIGPGKALNTENYFVIASNMLGGCRGTTGPSSANPETGLPYGSTFPKITVDDIVNVQALLVEQLGIPYLAAVIGGSLGGMQALQWSAAFPDRVKKCICIAAAPQLSPQALGFEIIGRKILQYDKDFAGGDYYTEEKKPGKGLAFARMIGLLTYLSDISMQDKFHREKSDFDIDKFETGFEVENYLSYNAKKFTQRFDANSYMHITYAMDNFDLERTYGSIENAFKETRAEFLLVALSSDWLFLPQQSKKLCRELLNLGKIASLIELDSPYGHDAFLLEVGNLGKAIHAFMENPEHSPPALPRPRIDRKTQTDTEKIKVFHPENDYKYLEDLIEPDSHILDIGCGDGELIDKLYHSKKVTGFGIDIDLENVVKCLSKNVPIVHSNADEGLPFFADNSFDYAVLSQTLQMLKKPHIVLDEMLRVAKKGIVLFPNFGNFRKRLSFCLSGKVPVINDFGCKWWCDCNMHQFSYKDFQDLCKHRNIKIENVISAAKDPLLNLFLKSGLTNLGAELIVARISRNR